MTDASLSPRTPVTRQDGRAVDELRPITVTRGFSRQAEGSALVELGGTRVLCTASFTQGVPRWLKGEGTGWVTAVAICTWSSAAMTPSAMISQ